MQVIYLLAVVDQVVKFFFTDTQGHVHPEVGDLFLRLESIQRDTLTQTIGNCTHVDTAVIPIVLSRCLG